MHIHIFKLICSNSALVQQSQTDHWKMVVQTIEVTNQFVMMLACHTSTIPPQWPCPLVPSTCPAAHTKIGYYKFEIVLPLYVFGGNLQLSIL
jgi:hypothetical protein